MAGRCRLGWLVAAALSFVMATGNAQAQDEPSLGDLARQQRQHKKKSQTVSSQDASSPKVITNDQISGHASVALPPVAGSGEKTASADSTDARKQPAEYWKLQIEDQKSQVAALESQVAELSESIRFAPGNCVANCVEWNQHQKEKQQQVERLQSQLEDGKRQLEQMQDSARKQGYGSAVYDP
jgi:hypothetical protein